MELYLENALSPVWWPERIATVYQWLSGGPGSRLTPKLPHLREWDALFLAALVQMPRESRPHGIITRAAGAFQVLRTSIYALGERSEAKLWGEPSTEPEQKAELAARRGELGKSSQLIEVTPNRLKRTILRAMFPGNVAIRPTQAVVEEALDERPSIGTISELRVEAGLRTRQRWRGLNYSGSGRVIVGRDETFFHGLPVLMVIEPVSMTILLAEVCADHQADTWGAALRIAQEQGMSIRALIEDMARNDEKSQALADLAQVAGPKATWHVLRDRAQLLNQLEKAAYAAMQRLVALEKCLTKAWSEPDFARYLTASAAETKVIAHDDAYAPLHRHFCDALEGVDWRSGEISDLETATWFLNAVLDVMAHGTDSRILTFLKTIRNHAKLLLTFLTWLQEDLPKWRATLQPPRQDPKHARTFERIVAQHGCL